MTEKTVRIRIADDDDLAAAQSVAEQYPDVKVEATSGPPGQGVQGQIEPISAILIGAGVAFIAKFVTDWWDKRRGGLVIDQRASAKDQIYRDNDVPYGYIVIFAADGGSVKVETKDMPKDAIHQLLESVISGAFTSATEIATAARETVEDAKVEVAD